MRKRTIPLSVLAALVWLMVAVPSPAIAAPEAPPCSPSHAITAGNTQVSHMTFRLMRCNNASAVFVEVFNLWPAPTPSSQQQANCWFRVERSPTGSTPTDSCLRSSGSPRYSDLFTISPGNVVRAAMYQRIRIPNVPESDWPEAYRFTDWVTV